MVIGGSIRAGRERAVKTAMMEATSALAIRVCGVSPKDLIISIGDIKTSNVMEGGHILPEPGDEAAWLAKFGPLLGLGNSGETR